MEGPRQLAVIDEAWCIGCTLCIKEGVQSNIGSHVDRATAGFQLVQHQVVTQTGRGDGGRAVRRIFLKLGFRVVTGGKIFAQTVEGLGLEQQEPGTDRTVAVLKTGRGETVFHHGKFSTGSNSHCVSGTCIPYWIPCTSFSFTN